MVSMCLQHISQRLLCVCITENDSCVYTSHKQMIYVRLQRIDRRVLCVYSTRANDSCMSATHKPILAMGRGLWSQGGSQHHDIANQLAKVNDMNRWLSVRKDHQVGRFEPQLPVRVRFAQFWPLKVVQLVEQYRECQILRMWPPWCGNRHRTSWECFTHF